jgi:hypothetical protein
MWVEMCCFWIVFFLDLQEALYNQTAYNERKLYGLSDQTHALFIKMSSQTQIPVSWCAVILPFVVSPAFLVFV